MDAWRFLFEGKRKGASKQASKHIECNETVLSVIELSCDFSLTWLRPSCYDNMQQVGNVACVLACLLACLLTHYPSLPS